MPENSDFQPNWLSAPAETILDLLEEQGLTLEHFLDTAGPDRPTIQSIIDGAVISRQSARRLGSLLGGTETFWLNRDKNYRGALSRQSSPDLLREWIAALPVNDMRRFGWIQPGKNAAESCLRFFGFSTVSAWKEHLEETLQATAFRTSPTFESCFGAVAAWLRQGELLAERMQCKPWNAAKLREAIPHLRGLTRLKDPDDFVPKLEEICADCGIATVIVRAPSGCTASGATRFLTESKALLMLSFRYLSDDHFWFTFFHELGHLLLHGNKIHLESIDGLENREEQQANDFAADALIPDRFWEPLRSLSQNYKSVMRFARSIGVSPGIIVGQLQHSGLLRHNQMNYLKRRFSWSKISP